MRKERGITLIALVITIIVLLILAGVAIAMLSGENGILRKAVDAKDASMEAQQRDIEYMDKQEGIIEQYVEGMLANKVNVGDYVEYNYGMGSEYSTSSSDSEGKDISNTIQTFSSKETGNAFINKWRVLSKIDGTIKLVAADVGADITLNGAIGYLNGEGILNGICEKLYSSNIGKARSINVEDINEITGYNGDKCYYDNNGSKVTILANEKKTIYDLENDTSLSLNKLTNRESPESGKNIGEYEIKEYSYICKDQMGIEEENKDIKYQVICRNSENSSNLDTYWLASSNVGVRFKTGYAYFSMKWLGEGSTGKFSQGAYWLMDSKGTSREQTYAFRPVVNLKNGLKVGEGDGTVNSPYKILSE